MINHDENATRTASETRVGRRYMWQVGAAMLLYLGLVLLDQVLWPERGTSLAVLCAVLPLAPMVWVAFALVGHLRSVDEMQRQLIINSLAIGFGASIFVALALGMVRMGGVSVPMPEWVIFVAGMSAWGVTATVLSLRANR